ncbi:MAG: dipeptide epimerase [Calditrichaeota bacterium]|nr:MAG: dipeptide epimerase [Calditrichota bacterium]
MAFKLHIETRRLFLAHTWTIARNSSDYKDNVFIALEKDGITGFGEAAPNVRYDEDAQRTTERIQSVSALLEQTDFFHYENLIRRVRQQITDQNCAVAAIDMALMDWLGKALNAPLYRIWGLDPADTPPTSYSIGIDTPANMQQRVRERGEMAVYKIKLGSENDRAIIEAIRAVTDKPVRVDANEGWKDKHQALENIRWLAGHNIQFVEQPMPAAQHEDMVWLKERSPLPLIADEALHTTADIPRIADGYHGINIKLMKSTGLQEARRMIHTARAMDMRVMLGCMVESSLAISAGVHLAPLTDFVDLDGHMLLADDPVRGLSLDKSGRILPSDQPGLGVVMD